MIKGLVTVVITTYRGSNYICRAIDSLINQTYDNIEIIVVDDNDPKDPERKLTEASIHKYKKLPNFYYIKHDKNMNGSTARNTGIQKANGEFIAFLDDDDYYLPMRISKSINQLRHNKNSKAIFCGVIVTDNKNILRVVIPQKTSLSLQEQLLFNVNLFGTGSNLFLYTECVKKIGMFDTTYYRLQDVEFLIRFLGEYNVTLIPEILIVKARSNVSNLPQYDKLLQIKLKFYEDFALVINNLGKDRRKDYFYLEYKRLLESCYGMENWLTIKKAIKDVKSFGNITLKDYIFVILSLIGKPKKNLYLFSRRMISAVVKKKRSNKLIKDYNCKHEWNNFLSYWQE